jgi:hypothetical protein
VLVAGPLWAVTADDVDCVKCVDKSDIALEAVNSLRIKDGAVTTSKIKAGAVGTSRLRNSAVTTEKIEDGAVTVDKVAPKLSNAIGQFCMPGQAVVGMDASGNFVCENFTPEWTAFDFPIGGSNVLNDCSLGEKYIKPSDMDPSLYVGAQVCSELQQLQPLKLDDPAPLVILSAFAYKLFLADSMGGPYWEISDSGGNGEDHCELIGGTEGDTSPVGGDEMSPSAPSGYCRFDTGEPFEFLTEVELTFDDCWRTDYYECGIAIPSGELDIPEIF